MKNDLNDKLNEFRMTEMNSQNATQERKRARIGENSPENGERNPKMHDRFCKEEK